MNPSHIQDSFISQACGKSLDSAMATTASPSQKCSEVIVIIIILKDVTKYVYSLTIIARIKK